MLVRVLVLVLGLRLGLGLVLGLVLILRSLALGTIDMAVRVRVASIGIRVSFTIDSTSGRRVTRAARRTSASVPCATSTTKIEVRSKGMRSLR